MQHLHVPPVMKHSTSFRFESWALQPSNDMDQTWAAVGYTQWSYVIYSFVSFKLPHRVIHSHCAVAVYSKGSKGSKGTYNLQYKQRRTL
jgi:hypothetical protein